MDIEQLSTMTEADLQATADRHLLIIDHQYTNDAEKQYHVSQAQFFLAELDRRKQIQERVENGKIADRDYKLEKWVIWLIGAELVLAVVGILFGWIEGNQQTRVLDKLNKSSAETATTLTTLQKEQEAALDTQKHTLENIVAMNDALQDEIDLNMTGAIRWGGGGGDASHHQVLYFENEGRTVLSFWGSKFGNSPPTMEKRPKILNPATSVPITVPDLVVKAEKQEDTSVSTIPFELYLTRNNGTKYVAKGMIQGSGYIPTVTTTRKQW